MGMELLQKFTPSPLQIFAKRKLKEKKKIVLLEIFGFCMLHLYNWKFNYYFYDIW